MKIFDLDSPLMNVLNKMADLMWLNILTRGELYYKKLF